MAAAENRAQKHFYNAPSDPIAGKAQRLAEHRFSWRAKAAAELDAFDYQFLAPEMALTFDELESLRALTITACIAHEFGTAKPTITEVPSDDARRARMSEFYKGLPPLPVDNAPAEAHQAGDEYVRALYAPFRWARNACGRAMAFVDDIALRYPDLVVFGALVLFLSGCVVYSFRGVRQ